MRLLVIVLTFGITVGGLFLFENYKTRPQEQDYARIVSDLSKTDAPAPTLRSPAKTPYKTSRSTVTQISKPTASPSTTHSPSPKTHIYYTSSSASAKYYYCDTDSGWKNLSKANLKQFSSPEELLKSYPTRVLHEPCK